MGFVIRSPDQRLALGVQDNNGTPEFFCAVWGDDTEFSCQDFGFTSSPITKKFNSRASYAADSSTHYLWK
jgi:hypothetical protein